MIGCKRPLPPPSSYESVRAQYRDITSWTKVDMGDDLLIGPISKRQRLLDEFAEGSGRQDTTGVNSHTVKFEEPGTLGHGAGNGGSSTLAPSHAKKKKPLFSSNEFRAASRNLERSYEEKMSDPAEQIRNLPAQSLDQKPDGPLAVASQFALPTAKDDASEAHMLLNLTCRTGKQKIAATDAQEEAESEFEQVRRRSETLGRERSRMMRAKALLIREGIYCASDSKMANVADLNDPGPNEHQTSPAETATRKPRICIKDSNGVSPEDDHGNASTTVQNHVNLAEDLVSELDRDSSQGRAQEDQISVAHASHRDLRPTFSSSSSHEAGEIRTQNIPFDVEQSNDSRTYQDYTNEDDKIRLQRLTEFHNRKRSLGREAVILDYNPAKPEPRKEKVRKPGPEIVSVSNVWSSQHTSGKRLNDDSVTAASDEISASLGAEQQAHRNVEVIKDCREIASLSPFERLKLRDADREQTTDATIGSRRAQSPAVLPSVASSKWHLVQYPSHEQLPTILTLPKGFVDMQLECQDAILRHEGLKERKRDLQTIETVVKLFAELGSLKMYDAKERVWLNEVKEFSIKVIDEKLYGRRLRDRMKQIGDSVKRRLRKLPQPDTTEIQKLMRSLLRNRFELLQNEMDTIDDEVIVARLSRLETLQRQLNESRSALRQENETPSRPPGSGDALPYSESNMTRRGRKSKQGKSTRNRDDNQSALERRRQAQFAFQDRKLANLKDRLSAFHLHLPENGRLSSDLSMAAGIISNDEATSEEDEGENYYAGAGVKDTLRFAQHPSEDLAKQIRVRAAQKSINGQQGTQLPDMSLASQNLANDQIAPYSNVDTVSSSVTQENQEDTQEFDDLSDEELGECVQNGDEYCYRYRVSAIYTGFEDFDDGVEYEIAAFLHLRNANAKVDEYAKAVVDSYKCSEDYRNDRAIEHRGYDTSEGWRDWMILLGQDRTATCRLRVTQEQFHPGLEAYKDARIHQACVSKPIYWVLWRKTLKPLPPGDINETDPPTVGNTSSNEHIQRESNKAQSPILQINKIAELEEATKDETTNVNMQATSTEEFDDMLDELFGPDSPSVLVDDTRFKSSQSTWTSTENLQDPCTSKWDGLAIPFTNHDFHIVSPPTPPPTNPISPASPAQDYQTQSTIGPPTTTGSPTTISNQRTLEIHFNEIQQFTTVALANRHAKDMYMQWYTLHMGGSSNEAFLRHEESQMEEDVKNCANMTPWQREEDFEVEVHRGLRAIESYKVWVEKKPVTGPSN